MLTNNSIYFIEFDGHLLKQWAIVKTRPMVIECVSVGLSVSPNSKLFFFKMVKNAKKKSSVTD